MPAPLLEALCAALALDSRQASLQPRSGSSFDSTYLLTAPANAYFVKRTGSNGADRLASEADGLARLSAAGVLRVPAVHGLFECETAHCLVLEALEFSPLSPEGAARLGAELAEHHRTATADRHGLDRDNWIGGTPQVNTPTADWTEFLFERRIGALIERLADAGTLSDDGLADRLRSAWLREIGDYRPTPSLLHGDLWSGNAALLGDGTPVVYDPAVHYGDRECDLAMAALFGGFGTAFFDAYHASWPLDPGWEIRRAYYQLYHVLNHALLFGGGYVDDAKRRIASLTD